MQHYTFVDGGVTRSSYMQRDRYGAWVLFDDAAAELESARKAKIEVRSKSGNTILAFCVDSAQDYVGDVLNTCEALGEELEKVKEALEAERTSCVELRRELMHCATAAVESTGYEGVDVPALGDALRIEPLKTADFVNDRFSSMECREATAVADRDRWKAGAERLAELYRKVRAWSPQTVPQHLKAKHRFTLQESSEIDAYNARLAEDEISSALSDAGGCGECRAPAASQDTAGAGSGGELERLREENAKLRDIVSKLPVTADGVPVVTGNIYYYPDPDGDDDWFPKVARVKAEMAIESLIYADPGWSDVYSTREAAEAARSKA